MGFREFFSLCWYRYHWEMRLGHYEGAIETCDAVVSHRKDDYVAEDWVILKARALARQGGDAAAAAYIASLFERKQSLPKLEEYLLRLRTGQERS